MEGKETGVHSLFMAPSGWLWLSHTYLVESSVQQLLEAEGVSIDLFRGYLWALGDQRGGSPGPHQRLGYNTLGALSWQHARMDPWESRYLGSAPPLPLIPSQQLSPHPHHPHLLMQWQQYSGAGRVTVSPCWWGTGSG